MKTNSTHTSHSTRDHSGEISLLAYHLWQQAGCPCGKDVHFWLQAEHQLLGRPQKQAAKTAKAAKPREPSSLTASIHATPAPKSRQASAAARTTGRSRAV